MSHNRKVSDDELIRLFKEYGSPEKIALALNMNVRSIYMRRRVIEEKYGISLTSHASPISENSRQMNSEFRASTPKKLDFTCEDGVILVASDAHYWPGEASTAHKAFVTLIKELKPKAVVMNGDVFDGAKISRHDPLYGTNPPTVREELDACRERLGEIEKAFNNAALIWTYGNHDSRLWRYLKTNSPEVEGMPGMDVFDYFPGWRHCYLVEVNKDTIIKHRWHNGVHATYNNTLKGGRSIVTGHLHRLQVSAWGDYNGRRYGVDTGTLAEPSHESFAYLEGSPTPWASGFVVLTYHKGQMLHPEIVEVINGMAYFRGKPI
jgi:predicted phosphodiesterase